MNCIVLILAVFFVLSTSATDFYVSTNGSDSANGSLATPFLTFEKARSSIQALNGTIGSSAYNVYFLQGYYRIPSGISLHYYDSGSPANPITYQSYTNADVHLNGCLQVTNWVPVTNAFALARLPSSATNSVYQADLSSFPSFLGVAAYGFGVGDGFIHQNELFWNGEAMTVAQFPTAATNWCYVGTIGATSNVFACTNSEPYTWSTMSNQMAGGWWKFDYLYSGYMISGIDSGAQQITVVNPGGAGWYAPTLGHRFRFINVLEALDSPGEYYFDRTNKFVYFWPPTAINSGMGEVSEATQIMLNLHNTTNVIFRGLTIEGSTSYLIFCTDTAALTWDHCTLKNCAGYGFNGVNVTNCVITDCTLANTGQHASQMTGGNRTTLVGGNNYITNSIVRDFARLDHSTRGISMTGVGDQIRHNRIYNAPHSAILYSGNNHTIDYNEIYNVCTESGDSGVIYAGNDWTFGGNVIRYNYLHDVYAAPQINVAAGEVVGVYLDDCLSGVNVYGNAFARVRAGIELGGGRSNGITNNMFVDVPGACVLSDQRLISWDAGAEPGFETKLAAMPYTTPPWSDQYPYMGTILTDRKTLAMYNVIAMSLKYGAGQWLTWFDNAQTNVTVLNIYTNNSDAVFVNYPNDLRLQASSPALIGGFNQIPFSQIGPIGGPATPGTISATVLNFSTIQKQ